MFLLCEVTGTILDEDGEGRWFQSTLPRDYLHNNLF